MVFIINYKKAFKLKIKRKEFSSENNTNNRVI